MSKVGYLYPQWMDAQWRLMQKLMEGTRLPSAVVEDFFHQHVFEFGSTFQYTQDASELAMVDVEKYAEAANAKKLASAILDRELFMKTESVRPSGIVEISHTILVLGVPRIGVTAGTRELGHLPPK